MDNQHPTQDLPLKSPETTSTELPKETLFVKEQQLPFPRKHPEPSLEEEVETNKTYY